MVWLMNRTEPSQRANCAPPGWLLDARCELQFDGVWASVGSTNFDNRSFALNDEVNATIYNADAAHRLERDFEEDLTYSRPVTYEAWKHRGLLTRVRELLTLPSAPRCKADPPFFGPW